MRPPLRAPAEPPEGKSFLYVIRSLQFCKIGRGGNLYMRLSNIRVDNPHDPELVRFWPVAAESAAHMEKLAQSIVWDHRKAGDWFEVAPEQAIEAVEKALAIEAERQHRWAAIDAAMTA